MGTLCSGPAFRFDHGQVSITMITACDSMATNAAVASIFDAVNNHYLTK